MTSLIEQLQREHALIAADCALLRVHDVAGARDALALAQALDDPDQVHGGAHAH